MPPEREIQNRLPPQSPEAEKSVLGSMLRDNGCIGDIVQIVRPESFYSDAHQKIYQSIIELYDKGHPVDLVMLAESLNQKGQLEDVGKHAYLASLWDAAPTAANAEYYARIVRDRALVRNLIHVSTEILRDAYDQALPADEMLEMAERRVLDVAQMGMTGQTFTLEQALQEAYDRIDRNHEGALKSISGLSTGYLDLDEITAGLQNSELVILAARPSVGKTAFALNLVRNIVLEEKASVFFVSLEQSRIELAERLLCSQARVNSHKLRKGHLSGDDMQRLIEAGGILTRAKLFIDDSPGQGMLRIAANARRLKLRENLRLVVIDYLQLIEPDNRRDPRQEQVAQISRRLKFLARELMIPVVALAQVNRSSEDRQDHRPRLADLRESGCLAGDTLLTLADGGRRVPIRELAGQSGFKVWALDEATYRLRAAEVSRAFSTGIKPVYRMTTRLGRSIRATANHKFRTLTTWKRLDELRPGDYIAVPRKIPGTSQPATMTPTEAALLGHLIGDGCTLPRHSIQYTTREADLAETVFQLSRDVFGERVKPRIRQELRWFQVYLASAERLSRGKRNPVAEWLDQLGVFGLRSWQKRVPERLFEQPEEIVSRFLRHLWATDGCIRPPRAGAGRHPAIYYASSSERLCVGIQSLLLRLGINAVLRRCEQKKGRPQFHLLVMGKPDIESFCMRVGAVGSYKQAALHACQTWVADRRACTNRDVIPSEFWSSIVIPAMKSQGVAMRTLQHSIGMAFMDSGLYRQNVSRERMSRVAQSLRNEPTLTALANSDIYWDRVISIAADGEEKVFDLTVPGPHNFACDSVIAHNSIEQDADTVFLLHRPDRYEPGQNEGLVEVLVAKQRNGPTGDVNLTYIKEFMRFENYEKEVPFNG